MRETWEVAYRLSVLARERELRDAQTRTLCVDRHPHLAAEAGRDGEARLACGLAQVALSGQRLPRVVAGARPDELSCDVLGDSEAAAASRCEGGDREVVAGSGERREISDEVGVG